MTFRPIEKGAVASWSDRIEPLLEKMVARSGGRLDADGVYASLAAGNYWLAEISNWQAAMVLNPINWKTGLNELEIVGLAGDGLKEWESAMFAAESIARDLNFHRLTIPHGRKGWTKLCAPRGWKETAVILEKELTDG